MRIHQGLIGLALLAAIGANAALAQDIGPTQEQELRDARGAIEAARGRQADKYAAPQIKLARDSVQSAEDARKQKSAEKFSRSARLARSYAELAQALAELGEETQNVAAANESVKNARAEIERLGNAAK